MTPPPPPSDRTPMPLGSDDENNSGAKVLTKGAARAIAKAQEEERRALEQVRREADEELAKTRRLKSYIWAAVGLVVSTAISVGGVVLYIKSEAGSEVARSFAPWAGRVTNLESDMSQVKETLGKTERSGIRTEAMVEWLTRERGMIPPPRQVIIPFTPTADGGR